MAVQPAITFACAPDHISSSASVSTSTASGNKKYPYDVFINHHPDIKKTLASQFHYGLMGHGLRVFESNEADRLTCEIEAAIKTASVHIAIFSARYAESVCCLNELLVMVESGSSIIPVFYDVEPSQLSYGHNGVFAAALHILGERYDSNTVGKWRKALSDIADISGVVLKACNGDEGMLVKKVINRLFENLKYVQGYDVFINHRGPDVKNTLASHLYNRLSVHDLRVFLKLREGQKLNHQINVAIRTASVHIAIFSQKYAESSWCLNELIQMVESGSTIIPVFYGVRPSDIRCTPGENGVYAQSLRIFEQKHRYGSDNIEKWRKALSEIREDDGFDLEAYNGDEGQLVDQIVRRVLRKIRRKRLNTGTSYLIGLDEKVEDFERKMTLHQQSEKAQVLGIVGIAGVGKTILAKEFFDRHRSNYERCCFLSNVRGNSLNLNVLQSRLLRDLIQRNVQIDNIDEGIEKLKRYHSSFDTLIIIDDVDHIHQLDALYLPLKDALNSGSLILVISRHKDFLIRSGIQAASIYELTGLNKQQSQELFCRHAFGQSCPVVGFEQGVRKVLKYCAGLPLFLQEFGTHLHGIDNLESWEAELRKIRIPRNSQLMLKTSFNALHGIDNLESWEAELRKSRIPRNSQLMLKTSFNALDPEEQNTCFIGKDKDTAPIIGNESGCEGSRRLRNLQKNCIKMHDRLKDLGRALAKNIWR